MEKRICRVVGCEKPYHAQGLCRLHHWRWWHRKKIGLPYDLDSLRLKYVGSQAGKRSGCRGEKNPRWNGGVSEYPNSYELKKNRLEVLEEANYVCRVCGRKATQVHHKDKSKTNHAKENRLAVCCKCNICEFHLDVMGRPLGVKNNQTALILPA